MNVAIIMATMRWENWARVLEQLRRIALTPGLRLFWLPVLYARERQAASLAARELLFGHHAPRWIKPLVIAEEPGVNHCVRKQNAALEELERTGFAGWLMTASDDNLLPAGLGRRLVAAGYPIAARAELPRAGGTAVTDRRYRPPGVIVFSHARGQHIPAPPPRDFGTSDLLAAPENMVVGRVSGEQYFVHASLLRGFRFAHHGCCDGELVQALHEQFPAEFCFVPDFFIPFNALEPGRWDEDKLAAALAAE